MINTLSIGLEGLEPANQSQLDGRGRSSNLGPCYSSRSMNVPSSLVLLLSLFLFNDFEMVRAGGNSQEPGG